MNCHYARDRLSQLLCPLPASCMCEQCSSLGPIAVADSSRGIPSMNSAVIMPLLFRTQLFWSLLLTFSALRFRLRCRSRKIPRIIRAVIVTGKPTPTPIVRSRLLDNGFGDVTESTGVATVCGICSVVEAGGLLMLAVAVDNCVVVVIEADDSMLEGLFSGSNKRPMPPASFRSNPVREQHSVEFESGGLRSHSSQQKTFVKTPWTEGQGYRLLKLPLATLLGLVRVDHNVLSVHRTLRAVICTLKRRPLRTGTSTTIHVAGPAKT